MLFLLDIQPDFFSADGTAPPISAVGYGKMNAFRILKPGFFYSAPQMPVSVFPEAIVHSPVRTDELPALEVHENFSSSHPTSDNKSLYPSFICPAVSSLIRIPSDAR